MTDHNDGQSSSGNDVIQAVTLYWLLMVILLKWVTKAVLECNLRDSGKKNCLLRVHQWEFRSFWNPP